MAECRACNAPIIWAVDESGERIPLDDHEMRDYGPKRYRIVQDGIPPVVAELVEESVLRAYVDHREICQQPRVI